MGMIKFFNKKIRFFTIWDIKLIQLYAMLVIIILIKLIPAITSLDYWWYIILLILTAVRPIYLMFLK